MPRRTRRRSTRTRATPRRTTRRRPPRAARALGFYAYRLADVMSRKVAVTHASDTLESAASAMSRKHVSGLPVVDARGRVVGVLSQKDIVRVLRERAGLSLPGGIFDLVLGAPRADLHARCLAALKRTKVRSAMSDKPATLSADAKIDEAVRLMVDAEFNRVPVVRRGKLVGIVTRTDLLTASARSG